MVLKIINLRVIIIIMRVIILRVIILQLYVSPQPHRSFKRTIDHIVDRYILLKLLETSLPEYTKNNYQQLQLGTHAKPEPSGEIYA